MLPSSIHWLSSCLVCVSEAYNVSKMLCSLARARASELLIVMLGASEHMDEACL
jgi:hypothetical protein